MKNILQFLGFVSVLALSMSGVKAQKMAIDKAEEFIVAREYHQAIPILTKLSGYKNADEWKYKLGYCYLKTRNFNAADSVFSLITTVPAPDYYLHFGEVKQTLAKYPEAITL